MKVNGSHLYHAGLRQIKRSTFCDALEKRKNAIFRSAFHDVANKAQMIAGKMKKKFSDPLRIIDMTVIPLCIERFDWTKYRATKGAVKLHLILDGDNLMPFNACLTDGKVHEKNRMKHLTDEPGVLYAMDREYIDYKSLYNIELRGSVFVTRMKNNCSFTRTQSNHHEGGAVLSDVLIELAGPCAKTYYPKPLRKIKSFYGTSRNAVYSQDMGRVNTDFIAMDIKNTGWNNYRSL